MTILDKSNQFWRNTQEWPKLDPKNQTFLGRAVHKMGKAVWPNEWTGEEPKAPYLYNIPNDMGDLVAAHLPHIKYVRDDYIATHSFNASSQEIRDLNKTYKVDDSTWIHDPIDDNVNNFELSLIGYYEEDAWRQLVKHGEELNRRYKLCHKRWRSLKTIIATQILHEEIAYSLRNPFNGEMIKGNSNLWNLDIWPTYFDYCRMSDFSSVDSLEPIPGYIFLDVTDIQAFLQRQSGDNAQANELWRAEAAVTNCRTWCRREDVKAEGNRRARLVFGQNPQQVQEAQAIATMWFEATAKPIKVATVEQYLVAARRGDI